MQNWTINGITSVCNTFQSSHSILQSRNRRSFPGSSRLVRSTSKFFELSASDIPLLTRSRLTNSDVAVEVFVKSRPRTQRTASEQSRKEQVLQNKLRVGEASTTHY